MWKIIEHIKPKLSCKHESMATDEYEFPSYKFEQPHCHRVVVHVKPDVRSRAWVSKEKVQVVGRKSETWSISTMSVMSVTKLLPSHSLLGKKVWI